MASPPNIDIRALRAGHDAQHPCRYPAVAASEFLLHRIAQRGYMDRSAAAEA